MTTKFEGFYGDVRFPTLAEQICDLLPIFQTLAELKVVIWLATYTANGQQRFGVSSIMEGILLDESGNGWNLSRKEILEGIELAIKKGLVQNAGIDESGEDMFMVTGISFRKHFDYLFRSSSGEERIIYLAE